MRFIARALRTLIGLALPALVFFAHPNTAGHADDRDREDVVVRVLPGTDIRSVAADYGTTLVGSVEASRLHGLRVPAGKALAAFMQELWIDPRIIEVEFDHQLSVQIHVGFDGDRGPGGYRNQRAYHLIHLSHARLPALGKNVRVAVLDTGVALDHPDLRDHLVDGYNALDPSAAPRDLPDGATNVAVGHGAMVAGIIARVAPEAQIMPIRVLNGDGQGTLLSVARGIRYAIDHQAQIINVSFGTPQESDLLEEMLDEAEDAGIVIVASAGNEGANVRRYPAAFGGTLAVASVDVTMRKSPFSNYGSNVAVVAPGSRISSTFWDGRYATWSGTSVAAPFVSATAALILSAHPQMEGDAVAEAIRNTAHSVDLRNPAYRGRLGAGLIDVERAVLNADR